MNWETSWEKATYFYHRLVMMAGETLITRKDELDADTIQEIQDNIEHCIKRSEYAGKRWRLAAQLSLGLRGSKRTFIN